MYNPHATDIIIEDSTTPLYSQLINVIKSKIKNGQFVVGDLLPSEAELCLEYNLSRSTVRHAMTELENEGLVIRRRGKGTFISEPKINRKVDEIYSFSKEMRYLGLEPSSKILDFRKTKIDIDLQEHAEINYLEENAYKIVRLRLANSEPLLLETTYIPMYVIPDLTQEMLGERSLYGLIYERTGFKPSEAEETYESVIIDKESAKLLGCKQNSSGFYIERKTWMKNGAVFELLHSIMRGDRSRFVLKLKNQGIEFNKSVDF